MPFALHPLRIPGIAATLCGLFLACSAWAAEPVVDVNAMPQGLPLVLTEHVTLLEDKSAALTFEEIQRPDILAGFQASQAKGNAFSFGFTDSAYWFRLHVRNNSNQPLLRHMEVGYAGISNVQWFQVTDRQPLRSYAAGGGLPFSTRPIPNRFFVFPMEVPAWGDSVIYVRVQTIKSVVVAMRLWEPQAFQAYERSDYIAQFWYFGMAAAMVAFNLLLFVSLRDRIYLMYVAFVATLALAIASGAGLSKEYLWPEATWLNEISVASLYNWAIAFFLVFMRHMLSTRLVVPRTDRWLRVLTVFYLLVPLGYAISFRTFAQPLPAIQAATGLAVVAVAVRCALLGQRSAYIFLLAFGALFLGGVANTLLSLGILPANTFTVNGIQFGSAAEMLLLALALADRLNESRQETLRAQADALKSERQLVETLRASERLLEERVQARTAELSSTVERLQKTQTELVQSEKLASLGSLVAGVAHELNTPIGNALTVATTLEDSTRALKSTMDKGEMRKSTLNRFVDDALPMSELIARSCERASALVSSFKRVAVDQTSEHRRKFDVHSLVEDVCNSLRPGFRNASWQMDIQIPEGIECDSYPGPLGQVVSNLIQNAAIHAFNSHPAGTLRLSATATDTEVALEIADNGAGMSPEVLSHIFDPFYTTRLGQGGSGLGLSICMNIVTGVLGGSLQALSEPGVGSRFVIRFPRVAPEKAFVDSES